MGVSEINMWILIRRYDQIGKFTIVYVLFCIYIYKYLCKR